MAVPKKILSLVDLKAGSQVRIGDVFRRLTCFLVLLSTGAALPVSAQSPDRPIRAVGGDVTYSVVIVGTLTPQGSGSGSGQ